MEGSALHGLRVLDISEGIAGPYAAKLLADSGAEVIKVEPTGTGDASRSWGPFPNDEPHPDRSLTFWHLNGGKKSVTLDLAHERGREVFRKLCGTADVLIESFDPGHFESLGIDLAAEFPDLVVGSVSAFGQTGPYAGWQGNHIVSMAMGGLMYVTGNPDREPLATGVDAADYFAALNLWIGILASLRTRALEGGGDHLDVSMQEAIASNLEYTDIMYASNGAIRRRWYSRHHMVWPTDIYPTADGHVVVIAGPTDFFTTIGKPEWAEDLMLSTVLGRWMREEEVDAQIVDYLSTVTSKEAVELAQALRNPWAYVPTVPELLTDEHLAEREYFVQTPEPDGNTYKLTGPPFRMSASPMHSGGQAPLLGGSNVEVYVNLGYTHEQVDQLRAEGVI